MPLRSILAHLEAEMLDAAEKLEFERAAALRDKILELARPPATARAGPPPARRGRAPAVAPRPEVPGGKDARPYTLSRGSNIQWLRTANTK